MIAKDIELLGSLKALRPACSRSCVIAVCVFVVASWTKDSEPRSCRSFDYPQPSPSHRVVICWVGSVNTESDEYLTQLSPIRAISPQSPVHLEDTLRLGCLGTNLGACGTNGNLLTSSAAPSNKEGKILKQKQLRSRKPTLYWPSQSLHK